MGSVDRARPNATELSEPRLQKRGSFSKSDNAADFMNRVADFNRRLWLSACAKIPCPEQKADETYSETFESLQVENVAPCLFERQHRQIIRIGDFDRVPSYFNFKYRYSMENFSQIRILINKSLVDVCKYFCSIVQTFP